MPASHGISARRSSASRAVAVLRHGRVGVGRLQRPLDRRLDRAPDAAELAIFGERQVAVAAIFEVEPLQREGEQRQRILAAALLDVGKQRRGQRRLDLERARVSSSRVAGPSITV